MMLLIYRQPSQPLPGQRTVLIIFYQQTTQPLPGQTHCASLAASIVCIAILQRLHFALSTTILDLVPQLGIGLAVSTSPGQTH